MSAVALDEVAELTRTALLGGAGIVFQATFFDVAQRPEDPEAGDPALAFVGFADFLRRTESGEYEVQDTKLARRVKVTALMQLAAYAEQLERVGIPVASEAVLILGDGARSTHRLADISPVFRARRSRLHEILLDRARAVGADGRRESAAPVAWGLPTSPRAGGARSARPKSSARGTPAHRWDPRSAAGSAPRRRAADDRRGRRGATGDRLGGHPGRGDRASGARAAGLAGDAAGRRRTR
ncbi:hypothetical protein [Leucobacter soli]|uniref:hypothetical protein n=1 Tax=Leucobacter soli TaxID=2812850 RepID=UPI00361BA143